MQSLRAVAFWLTCLLHALPVGSAQSGVAPALGEAVWAYTDDRGRLLHVQRLEDVPQRLRGQAIRVDRPDSLARAPSARDLPGEPQLYGYRGPDGRTIFTNLADSVPAAQRAGSRIDLSAISLNSELGADLDRQLAKEHRALQKGPVCAQLQAAADEPFWWVLWHEHAPLVVCGGVLLFGVLLSPWMLQRGWGAQWAKVLTTATPILGFVGVSGFLLLQTSRSTSALQQRAERCQPGAYLKAETLKQRVQLVQALEAEQQALAQIHAESR